MFSNYFIIGQTCNEAECTSTFTYISESLFINEHNTIFVKNMISFTSFEQCTGL